MKTKVKTKKISYKDDELSDMFNKMLDIDSADAFIVYPKYSETEAQLKNIKDIFTVVANSLSRQYPEVSAQCAAFCMELESFIAANFTFTATMEESLGTFTQDRSEELFVGWRNIKSSRYVRVAIMLCDNIIEYHRNFDDLDNLNPKFVMTMPGTIWVPFPFMNLNVKELFETGDRNYIMLLMTVFNKSYSATYNIYKIISDPDIDTEKFVDVIMDSIESIQKIPELSRCRKAFEKIKSSVHLLKNNFSGYYRDFVSTKDSTIIMQHFVLDVSKSIEADIETTRQFKDIIKYYKKYAQSSTNPNVHKLLDKLQNSFKELERVAPHIVSADSNDNENADANDNTMGFIGVNDPLPENE